MRKRFFIGFFISKCADISAHIDMTVQNPHYCKQIIEKKLKKCLYNKSVDKEVVLYFILER